MKTSQQFFWAREQIIGGLEPLTHSDSKPSARTFRAYLIEGVGPWAGRAIARLHFGQDSTFALIADSLVAQVPCIRGAIEPIPVVSEDDAEATFNVLFANDDTGHIAMSSTNAQSWPAGEAGARIYHLLMGRTVSRAGFGFQAITGRMFAETLVSQLAYPEKWLAWAESRERGRTLAPPSGIKLDDLPHWP